MHSSAISRLISILPLSLFFSVVRTASSRAFNAALASPFAASERKSAASSDKNALNAPSPFSSHGATY